MASDGREIEIVVAGGSGFLGHQLSQALGARGDEVITLSRWGPPLPVGRAWLDERTQKRQVVGQQGDVQGGVAPSTAPTR